MAQNRTKENLSKENDQKLEEKKHELENRLNKASDLAEQQKLERVMKA